jgi:catechol 2,3-dioxygenase-like lactoylglutathione lyase family enzyme
VQIKLASIFVDDQDKALRFYTGILGFAKMADIPMGTFRWLTVTSAEETEGAELALSAVGFPPAERFQRALYDAGIAATAFVTADIEAEYQRLRKLGVVFRGEPATMGSFIAVIFEDTCGNLINLVQRRPLPPAE